MSQPPRSHSPIAGKKVVGVSDTGAQANKSDRSPALIPKPADWGPHITIAGFFFLPLASSYTPEPALTAFLEAGPPPVYIGFGSIVVKE